MPIYEYVCPRCGMEFEQLASMSRAGKATICANCGGIARPMLSRTQRPIGDTPLHHGTPHSQDPKFLQQWSDIQESES